MSSERERIVILGGGIGGLTTALELTATPELRARHDVTVHQLGWRAGGKCAAGRQAEAGDRILEHGLHLWFNGYDNAFRLLRDCYDELDRPEGHPLRDMESGWRAQPTAILYDHYDDRWSAARRTYPIEPGRPWDHVEVPRFWDLVVGSFRFVTGDVPRPVSAGPSGPLGLVRRLGNIVESAAVEAVGRYLDRRHRHGGVDRRHLHPTAWVLTRVRSTIWRRRVRDHLDHDETRHWFSLIDMVLTSIIGMIRDDVLTVGFGQLDDQDFRAWLQSHGAQQTTLDGPDVRASYDQVFAGSAGPATTDLDPASTERPGDGQLAAGVALYAMWRTNLPGRGSVMWQARAGMGDTAIAPMYETLVERGVKFEFFSKVTRLGVDTDQRTVDTIDLVRQARVAGDRYDPLRDVAVGIESTEAPAGTLRCWPSTPNWDQLVDGARLRELGLDFEAGDVAPDAESIELRLGVDFDRVVLAISAAALPAICAEVMAASEPFDAMLRQTHTIMTQAFQIWMDTAPSELGFPYGGVATSTFIEPLDTGADNSQVLWSENWPGGGEPAAVWYFCGVIDDQEGDTQESTTHRARANALSYLDRIGPQWPGAIADDGKFRQDLLATRPGASAEPFDQQYWRANWVPTERYVQSLPGTIDARLGADESGLSNLFLAGDWTENSFNLGAVEATVMSGMLASRAMCGFPERIAWEGHDWLTAPPTSSAPKTPASKD